ncbi:MAG: glycoside hydrolase family 55 protein [Puniceicoccales bacterium]|nr:glycoside hydrolase family 55 protein [Puniceicoccales bacterium]
MGLRIAFITIDCLVNKFSVNKGLHAEPIKTVRVIVYMVLRAALLLFAGIVAFTPVQSPAETSLLWGNNGERWSPGSRLPDYSWTGYQCGEKPLPEVRVVANIRNYGAKGDGKTDDTAAFKKALAEAKPGAILIPAGRYVITDFLELKNSGIVLRGEGPEKTILYFPKSLSEIKPAPVKNSGGTPTQAYSWSQGFITFRGNYGDRKASFKIASNVERATNVITLEKSERPSLKRGDWILLRQSDPGDMSFVNYLYNGTPGKTDNFPKRHGIEFPVRVAGMSGTKITLERTVPMDFRPEWGASFSLFSPSMTESGIEHLSFEFPVTTYGGHFREPGYNPISFSRVAHCWVRNVHFENADSGFFTSSHFCTFTGIIWKGNRKPDKRGNCGHHGTIFGGTQNLLTQFEFQVRYIHDLTVSSGSYFNVISQGKGPDIAFDHHERAPTGNLFSDIDIEKGTRAFDCGGGAALGKNCASWGTFWNIRSQGNITWPKPAFGPELLNFVGVTSTEKPELNSSGRWFEPIPPDKLVPRDIHTAQLKRRLSGKR